LQQIKDGDKINPQLIKLNPNSEQQPALFGEKLTHQEPSPAKI